ncbi:MAG: DNA polymerase III subunit beta, partial [Planctomycetota bacterium]
MKVDCNRENLANAFALAASVAPARSPKEILQFVKLTATESGIVLTATDLEVGIRLELSEGIDVLAEGNALLSVSRTNSILRETSDETLTLQGQ